MGGGRANGAPPRRVSADRAARPSSNPHSHRTLPRVCLGGWSGALGGCGCVRARAVPCVRGRSQQEKTTRARASERAGALAAPPPASIFLFRSRALQARRVNTTHGRRRAPPVPVGRDPAPPHHRGGGHGGPVAARAAGERRRAGSRCIGFFFFFFRRRATHALTPSPLTQAVTSLSPFRDFVLTNKFGNAIDVGDLGVRCVVVWARGSRQRTRGWARAGRPGPRSPLFFFFLE